MSRKLWRGLFGGHIVRTLHGTYWGGLRDNWAYACFITTASEDTLKRHYVAVRSAVRAMELEVGPNHCRRFDDVMDRLLQYNPDDDWDRFWATFDPKNPDAALRTLTDPEAPQEA